MRTIKSLIIVAIPLVLSNCASTAKTDRDSVHDSIGSHRGGLRDCYAELNPNIEGRVVLDFVIAPNGQAQEVRVSESTLHNPAIEECVVKVFQKIRFRPSALPTSVKYPIVFQKK